MILTYFETKQELIVTYSAENKKAGGKPEKVATDLEKLPPSRSAKVAAEKKCRRRVCRVVS